MDYSSSLGVGFAIVQVGRWRDRTVLTFVFKIWNSVFNRAF
jgi:hypothetical protein